MERKFTKNQLVRYKQGHAVYKVTKEATDSNALLEITLVRCSSNYRYPTSGCAVNAESIVAIDREFLEREQIKFGDVTQFEPGMRVANKLYTPQGLPSAWNFWKEGTLVAMLATQLEPYKTSWKVEIISGHNVSELVPCLEEHFYQCENDVITTIGPGYSIEPLSEVRITDNYAKNHGVLKTGLYVEPYMGVHKIRCFYPNGTFFECLLEQKDFETVPASEKESQKMPPKKGTDVILNYSVTQRFNVLPHAVHKNQASTDYHIILCFYRGGRCIDLSLHRKEFDFIPCDEDSDEDSYESLRNSKSSFINHLSSNNQYKTLHYDSEIKDGTAVKVRPIVAAVSNGQRIQGTGISGKTGRVAIRLGYLSNRAIDC